MNTKSQSLASIPAAPSVPFSPVVSNSKSRFATWSKRALLVAAAWNILGGASALLDPANHFASMYSATLDLSQPLQLFFFHCVWINVAAWGIGYAVAAFLPAARNAILIAGGLGKTAYFAASVSLFLTGVGNAGFLAAGIFDLFLAGLFAWIVLGERNGDSPGERRTSAAL